MSDETARDEELEELDEDEERETKAPAVELPCEIELKHPIEFGKRTVSTLHFRRGRAGDMKGIKLYNDAVPFDDLTRVAARLCGEPTGLIEKLDEEDAGEVYAIALGFYGRCLATGKMLSQS